MKKVFIGSAWPYANADLHLGHVAGLIAGDPIARYYRKIGADVLYVSGTDCHGTPIALRAHKEGRSPEEIALSYHTQFQEVFEKLNFSFNIYTNTNTSEHQSEVQALLQQLAQNGYLYPKEEEQDYCSVCHKFLSDREIEGTCPVCGGHAKGDQCDECTATFNSSELKNKVCKYCNNTVSSKKDTHLYFELSAFQSELKQYVLQYKALWRENAFNESLKYLQAGLQDRAISRNLDWGIPLPFPEFEDKKVYVWIEAVLGYISAGKHYCTKQHLHWEDFYKSSSDLITYFIHGKDNIPFHTLIFPALLLGLKENFQLPDFILSSEYLNIHDQKISKSLENGTPVLELLKDYPSDTLRFYLLYNAPETKDTNFSEETCIQLHNTFLVNQYGNFVHRNLSYLLKHFGEHFPFGTVDKEVLEKLNLTYRSVGDKLIHGRIKSAIKEITNLVQYANTYYDSRRPWLQVKADIDAFADTTATCIVLIVNIANLYEPFLPESSQEVFSFLGLSTTQPWKVLYPKEVTISSEIHFLFKRLSLEDIQKKHI